jgi:GT2 family glycosyltransferase
MEPVVIVVPRERGSVAYDSLQSIISNTVVPFKLVYIDGCLTRRTSQIIRKCVESNGHEYIRTSGWCYPNQARNLGIERAGAAEHLVFVDNDIFVQPGWLGSLVTCADETGAGVVGPLYLEGDRQNPTVHCAGGEINRIPRGGGRSILVTKQYELGVPVAELPQLTRKPTGLVEFHCVLVARRFLDDMGGRFDEGLRTTREHVDLCLLAQRHGASVYIEPKSCVRYENTRSSRTSDIDFFMFRWSEHATAETIAHFERKWNVALDPQRQKIIKGRRRAFSADMKRNPLSRLYLFTWKRARRVRAASAALHWFHRNAL